MSEESSTPPTTAIVTKSRNGMESRPKLMAEALASTARYGAENNVRVTAATTF
jgi:hypothetical protein